MSRDDDMDAEERFGATRPPTREEAVDWIMRHNKPVHHRYRLDCIVFYERQYGAVFAECVKREVEKRFKVMNAKKIR